MSNTNPHQDDQIDAGFFYCPYVPLQAHSVYGIGIIELGLFYGDTHYNNIHAMMADVIRKELKHMRAFIWDLRPW